MKIKKFQKISKFLQMLLLTFSIAVSIGILALVFLIFSKPSHFTFNYRLSQFLIFSATKGELSDTVRSMSGIISSIPLSIAYIYSFWKGSLFFKTLSQGKTPFSIENYKLLKKVGITLIILNILNPLFLSLVTTLSMSSGYYISLGFDTGLLIGLIIYCMAEVISYGGQLQILSDETV